MLKIAFSDKELHHHRDEIEAYFSIYVGHLAEEFSNLQFQLGKDKEKTGDGGYVYKALFKSVPFSGSKPMHIETKSTQAHSAIELCFARARRTILRENRIAALS